MKHRNWVVMAALAACLGHAGCTGDGVPLEVHKSAIDESRRLKMQVEELEEKLRTAEDLATPSANNGKQDQEVGKLLDEAEKREAELEALKKAFREYKGQYRASVREKIVGTQIASLKTSKGVFEEVLIKEVTAVGLRIQHKEGTGRVRFEDLSKKLQDQLGYDEEEAAEYLQAEMEARELAAAKSATLAKARIKDQLETHKHMVKEALEDRRRELARLEAWIPSAESQVRVLLDAAADYDSKHYWARRYGRSSSWGPRATAKRAEANTVRARIQRTYARIGEIRAILASNRDS